MTKHVLYGGSNADRWRHCPGWASLTRQMPRRPVGEAAHAGSAQHEIMERMLKDPERQPEHFDGVAVPTEGGDIVIHSGHVAALRIAISAWESIIQEHEDREDDSELHLFSERFFGIDDEGGTVDALAVKGSRATFVDFKFGQYEVAASGWQNYWYMICARKEAPSLFKGVEEWESVIIQPAYDPAIDRVTISTATLDRMEEEARLAIQASKGPNPPFREGDWCRYCNAKIACPPKLGRLSTLTMPNHVLDLAETEKLLYKIREWRKWEEEAEQRLLHELEHGWKGEFFKLVSKRAVRKWINEAIVIDRLRQHMIKSEDYMKTELRSPAQVEEQGFLSKAEVKELAEPVSSGHTIAPMSDKRPAILPIGALAQALKR